MELEKLSLVLISIGILFMLLAVLKTRDLLGLLKGKSESNSWRVLFFMMLFFLVGYVGSFSFILQGQQEYEILLTGLVFLLGALFVYIVTMVSSRTINDLLVKDKTEKLNEELKTSEGRIKQKSEALESANKELEQERKQLESIVGKRTSELTALNVELKREIEEHKKTEQELAENKDRLERQNKALHLVTKIFKPDIDNLIKPIHEVTEISSETMNVERVSVWLYGELHSNIRCIDLYESSKNKHTDGEIFYEKDYPTYFEAIELNRVIDASDARKDPRTYEYSESYLTPLGITSMLDAPIRKADQLIGVVCFEHVGPQRIWNIDEQLFAGSIADSISILLESVERSINEKGIQEREQRLSSIYDTVGDLIFVLSVEKDERCKFVSVNKMFETTTGLSYDQVVGKYIDEIIPQPSLSLELEKCKTAMLGKKIVRWEEVFDYPPGQLTGEVSVAPIFDENGNCTMLVGAVHDITDRKKAENEIRKLNEELEERVRERTSALIKTQESLQFSETKYRKIVEEAGDAVYSADHNGYITYVNPICKKLSGYQENELVGRHFSEIIAPEWKEKVEKFYKEQFERKVPETLFSFPIIAKSGDKKWVEQIVTQQKEGDRITGHQAIVRDITQRKKDEAEIKQKSDELARSNKELEQFAYVSSHDLQEPLLTISNFMGLFVKKYSGKLDKDADLYIKFMIDAANRMRNLVKDLLEFSRVGRDITFETIDCNNILKEVEEEMAISIEESHALITISNMPVLTGNKTELKRLFQNLISNALKFRKKDVPPKIEIAAEEKETEFIFAIKDNGIGIEEQFEGRLFIIFQRLHKASEYPGTGIGLAMCKKIVALHNGKIWVESKAGEGSTFYFSIPKEIDNYSAAINGNHSVALEDKSLVAVEEER